MRTLLVNTFDVNGGAARAAFRLHQGLRRIGVDSDMLVRCKTSQDDDVRGDSSELGRLMVKVRGRLDNLPILRYQDRKKAPWSTSWLPNGVAGQIRERNPDVVHLHWINGGWMSISAVAKLRRPIVWTLHDMWPFTGGCHYAGDCSEYERSCGSCPQLNSSAAHDLSRSVWNRKRDAWPSSQFTIVSPSRWLADKARSSALFRDARIETIPNGIDTEKFRPFDRMEARERLGLPRDKRLILFGAADATSDPRKGFRYLEEAFRRLPKQVGGREVELVVFGNDKPVANESFQAVSVGKVGDDRMLSLLYSAADLFVCPSLEENLPNTVMEAMACGTPCVSFDVGGLPDLIEHRRNGYRARAYEPEDLVQGILWLLEDEERHQRCGGACREDVADKFELTSVARRYERLYRSVSGLE